MPSTRALPSTTAAYRAGVLLACAGGLGAYPRAAQAHAAEFHGWGLPPALAPEVLLPLAVVASLYAAGCWRCVAHRRMDARLGARVAAFAAGLLLLALALIWPLDAWAARSFAAHMAQHMVLAALAPPLLLAGRPGAMILRGLPPRWRAPATAWRRWPGRRTLSRWTASAGLAALLHGVALWAWHVPAAFELALRQPVVHWLEHLTLLATGVLFWRTLLQSRGAAWGAAAGWSLVTVIHSGFLGALLTLAPRPLYGTYVGGLGPSQALVDQQVAGLIMWVPMAMVYLVGTLAMLRRGLGADGSREAAGAVPPSVLPH